MLTCLCISFAVGCRSPKGASVKEKRSYVLQMKRETLAELYKEHPDAKARVARAPGHAVFSLVGSKILMLATGNGFGVATDAKTGRNTFMRMVEAGGGVGIGYKVYKAVYVFNDKAATRMPRSSTGGGKLALPWPSRRTSSPAPSRCTSSRRRE
jgi:hypothetical protein